MPNNPASRDIPAATHHEPASPAEGDAASAVSSREEAKFIKLFEPSSTAETVKKAGMLISTLLVAAATALFIPADTATYASAFGLTLANLAITLVIVIGVDAYTTGRKEMALIEQYKTNVHKILHEGDRESEEAKFKALKAHTNLLPRTLFILLAQGISVAGASCKFAGILSGNAVLESSYFLLGFMIAPTRP